MSHSLEFLRFERGEIVPFALASVRSLLAKHGCSLFERADGHVSVVFPIIHGTESIGGEDGLITVENGQAISFGIGRPLYDEPLRILTFELLLELGLCVFPSFGEEVHTVSARAENLPENLLETCEKGLQTVTSPEQLW